MASSRLIKPKVVNSMHMLHNKHTSVWRPSWYRKIAVDPKPARPLSNISVRFQTFPIAFKHFRPLSNIPDRFQTCSTAFNNFRPLSNMPDRFQTCPTAFIHVRPLSNISDRFETLDTLAQKTHEMVSNLIKAKVATSIHKLHNKTNKLLESFLD